MWSGAKRVSRIAAAVLIGVGVGYEAARNWPPVRPSPPLATTAATEQAAAEALGVEYFADASPAGLYAALPDLSDDSEPEEGRS